MNLYSSSNFKLKPTTTTPSSHGAAPKNKNLFNFDFLTIKSPPGFTPKRPTTTFGSFKPFHHDNFATPVHYNNNNNNNNKQFFPREHPIGGNCHKYSLKYIRPKSVGKMDTILNNQNKGDFSSVTPKTKILCRAPTEPKFSPQIPQRPKTTSNFEKNFEKLQTAKIEREKTDQKKTAENDFNFLDENILEKFEIGKVLGQGAYAQVRKIFDKNSDEFFACKIYDKNNLTDGSKRKSLKREIKILSYVKHANIVKFQKIIDCKRNLYLLTECVEGGNLHQLLKSKKDRKLEDETCRKISHQVVSALKYLHDRNIVHRDIKLENVLLRKGDSICAVLIDFGFSTVLEPGEKSKVYCGTPSYMSPEIILRKEHFGKCADVWSFGVLVFALCNGFFPFRAQTDKELYKKIVKGGFAVSDYVSEKAHSLIKKLIQVEPVRRPSFTEVLRDGWFSGLNLCGRSGVHYQSSLSTMSNSVHEVVNSCGNLMKNRPCTAGAIIANNNFNKNESRKRL